MPIHPATFVLYAGGTGYGHYDGTTWSSRSPQLIDFVATPTVLYAVSDLSQYLYRSLDGGASFTPIGTATGAALTGIARLRSGRIIVSNVQGGLRFTDDEGTTWQTVTLPPEILNIRYRSIFVIRSQVILIAVRTVSGGNPLYRSADQGATWQRVTPDVVLPFAECVFETRNGTLLAIRSAHGFSGYQELLRSTDQGLTWQVVYSESGPSRWGDLNAHVRQKIVQLASGRLVAIRPQIAGWVDGYISDDDGLTWTRTGNNVGPSSGMVYNARSATWYWGGVTDVDQVFQSTDEGATWQGTGILSMLYSGTGLGSDEVVTPAPRSLRLSTVPGVSHDSPAWGKEVLPQWRWSKDVIA
jgi:hypothetical protein